jgi:hypothetical protein
MIDAASNCPMSNPGSASTFPGTAPAVLSCAACDRNPKLSRVKARIVKLKRGKDGYLAPDPPVTVSPDEVAHVIREERDSR